MVLRASMAALIAHVRLLIHDPAGVAQVFTDQQVQDALDNHRVNIRYLMLTPAETIGAGGVVSYLDYYAEQGDWEANEVLQDGRYATLTPATVNRIAGHWTFTASQPPPIFVTGRVYDLYGAAADLLEAWVGRVKMDTNFSADGHSFDRSQRGKALVELAREYRRRQRPARAYLVRNDVVS